MRVFQEGDISPAVSLEEFKRAAHIAEEDLDDDAHLSLLLDAADEAITTATGHPLTVRSIEFVTTLGAWRRWWFPMRPVQELLELAVDDGNGAWIDQPLAGAHVQFENDEPQLVLADDWAGFSSGGDLLRIRADVGQNDGRGPRQLKPAIILMAREWFEAGTPIDAQELPRLSFGVLRLIRQARYRRPRETGGR